MPQPFTRGGIFQFRRAVPDELVAVVGKLEIKRSLQTRDPSEARLRYAEAFAESERQFNRARAQLTGESILTPEDVKQLASRWYRGETLRMDALGEFTSRLATERVVTDPTNGDEVTLYRTLKEHWARDGEDWNAEAMVEPMVVDMLRESGLPKPAKHAPAWGWLVSEFDARLHQLSAWALARHEGGSTLPGDGALPHLPLSTEVQQAVSVEAQSTPGRTLKALFDTYAEAKRSIDKSRSTEVTLGEYGSAIDDFIELHGDVGVELISRDLVSEHHVKLAKLPGKGKGIAKLTAPERIARAERDGLPRLSIATVRNRLRKLSAVLTYGVGRGWLTENPINSSGLGREVARAATRQQSTTRRRKHYTHEDLAIIFSSVAFTDLAWKPARASFGRAWYWLPILMYYSGARIEELAQLDASDVKQSSKGIPYLGVLEGVDGDDGARTVKTESSRRMIPLHDDVIARGFLQYVAGLPAKGRLFPQLDPCPDGYYSTNFAKRWGYYLRDTVGLKTSANPSHGFRHTYPGTSLGLARRKADEARALLAEGKNPSDLRKAEKASWAQAEIVEERNAKGLPPLDSFEAVAREWFDIKKSGWAPMYAEKIVGRLVADVFPYVGQEPVVEITPVRLLGVLRRIEKRGVIETAHRALENCSQVFRYAVATGRMTANPARDLKDALRRPEPKHMAAITDPKRFGELLRACDAYAATPVVRAAFKVAPMLLLRPGELRFAEWAEIDLDAAVWTVPSARMKREVQQKLHGAPHLVPLPRQAVAVFRELHELTGRGKLVFRA